MVDEKQKATKVIELSMIIADKKKPPNEKTSFQFCILLFQDVL